MGTTGASAESTPLLSPEEFPENRWRSRTIFSGKIN
jgi:hypothetical protein